MFLQSMNYRVLYGRSFNNFVAFRADFFEILLSWASRLHLNSVNQLILVMVKCGVLFEVRTEFLNNI
jgi:hypothetical protein